MKEEPKSLSRRAVGIIAGSARATAFFCVLVGCLMTGADVHQSWSCLRWLCRMRVFMLRCVGSGCGSRRSRNMRPTRVARRTSRPPPPTRHLMLILRNLRGELLTRSRGLLEAVRRPHREGVLWAPPSAVADIHDGRPRLQLTRGRPACSQ